MQQKQITLVFTVFLVLSGVVFSEDCIDLVGYWPIPSGGAVTYDDGTTCTCLHGNWTCEPIPFPSYVPFECAPFTNCTCKDPNSAHIFRSGDASNYGEDVCTCVKGYWYCKKDNKEPSDRCIDLLGKFVPSGDVQDLGNGLQCGCLNGLYRCDVDVTLPPPEVEEEEVFSNCHFPDGSEVLHGELASLQPKSRCKCYNGKFIDCECAWSDSWYGFGELVPTTPFSHAKCSEGGRLTEFECLHKDATYALQDTMYYNDMSCKCTQQGWQCCKTDVKCIKNKPRRCLQHSLQCSSTQCIHWRGKCLKEEPVCTKYEYKCVKQCCQKYEVSCTKYKKVCGVNSGDYYQDHPFCEKTCIEKETSCAKYSCSKYEHVCSEYDYYQDSQCVEYDCKHKCLTHICTSYDVKCVEYSPRGCFQTEEYCKPILPEKIELELV